MNNLGFNPFEFHHLYWGFILVVIGFFIADLGYDKKTKKPDNQTWWTIGCLTFFLGLVTMFDDILQHWVIGQSPMNQLFHYLWGLTGWKWPFGSL